MQRLLCFVEAATMMGLRQKLYSVNNTARHHTGSVVQIKTYTAHLRYIQF